MAIKFDKKERIATAILISTLMILGTGLYLGTSYSDENESETPTISEELTQASLTQTDYTVPYGSEFTLQDLKYTTRDDTLIPTMGIIDTSKLGTVTRALVFTDITGEEVCILDFTVTIVDKANPTLTITPIELVQFDTSPNLMGSIVAIDNVDGDISSKVVLSQETVDTSTVGTQTIRVGITDSSNNSSHADLTVNVVSRFTPVNYTKYVSNGNGATVYLNYDRANEIGRVSWRDLVSITSEVVGYTEVLQITLNGQTGYINKTDLSDTQPSLPVVQTPTPVQQTPAPTPEPAPTPQPQAPTPEPEPTKVIPDSFLGGRGGGGGNGLGSGTGDAY